MFTAPGRSLYAHQLRTVVAEVGDVSAKGPSRCTAVVGKGPSGYANGRYSI